jgi:hypothetical protein
VVQVKAPAPFVDVASAGASVSGELMLPVSALVSVIV